MFERAADDTSILPGSSLYCEIEALLYREAELMDSHALDDWLGLWHPDGLYWVPSNGEVIDPGASVSIIYERYPQIEDRIFRLKDKRMHSQSPKSRLIRIISNITVSASGSSDILAFSNFILGEVRGGEQQSLFGRAAHRLIREPEGIRILGKKVYLIANDSPMRNVTFLL
jgi:3-phenylpropionate/cinnamic acid dioxygenase small subunit